uniref:Uncharacterized protein n=1 Tax=Anguilla anguilla TaxID=7936 RepID=A0A0E9THV8_ANGAN
MGTERGGGTALTPKRVPPSTDSQFNLYTSALLWLWRLQYLWNYLNCIFNDFILYLHAK